MASKGRKTARESDGGGYWRWLRVDYGTTGEGWIAGPLHIVPVHPGKPSVVCEDALCDTKGQCPHCGPKTDVQDLGYQPVYRDDNIPCVLTLHQHQFELVEGYNLGVPIKWGRRGGDDAESVYVVPRLQAPHYQTTLAVRRQPADITIAICRYWKRPDLLPSLLRHFGQCEPVRVPVRVGDGPPATVTPATVAPKPRAAMGKKARFENAAGAPMETVVTDVMKNTLARVKAREAELNGKHS